MTMRRSRVATRPRQDCGLLLAFTFLVGLMIMAFPARAGCLDHIVNAEKEMNIPKGILMAVFAGRKRRAAVRPTPSS